MIQDSIWSGFNLDFTKENHVVVVCRKKLARRLLFARKVNMEHERSILSKIKGQQGRQYTSKMEGMVRFKMIIFFCLCYVIDE